VKISLRPWQVADAMFCCYVRNDPKLMKVFRQDEPITLEEQRTFILMDIINRDYNGQIVMVNGKPAGLCGVKATQEFTIAVLPEYQKKGISTKVMKMLIRQHPQMWSEVFVGNPALEWFISKLGFRVTGVKERAYYKKEIGLVDIVRIEHA
jgi:ribosomal protein S18 acetylase RimI-like enzyme